MVHLVTNVAEYGIIIDEEKQRFLLIQWNEYYNFTWHFPGGRIDEDEQEKEGLKREMREEISAEIENIRPIYAKYVGKDMMMKPTDVPRYALFYLCTLKNNSSVKINEKGHVAAQWFSKTDLPSIKFWLPFYREMLEEVLPF